MEEGSPINTNNGRGLLYQRWNKDRFATMEVTSINNGQLICCQQWKKDLLSTVEEEFSISSKR